MTLTFVDGFLMPGEVACEICGTTRRPTVLADGEEAMFSMACDDEFCNGQEGEWIALDWPFVEEDVIYKDVEAAGIPVRFV